MTNLLTLFSNNILPIFLAASTGYLLSKYLKINSRSISQLAFYIFSPCLIYTLLTENQLTDEAILQMGGFTFLSVLIIGAITWLIGSLFRLERRLLVAVILTAMFGNAGNYGLSLNLFAFGDGALAYASLYFVSMSVIIYTFGVIIASLGSMSVWRAIVNLYRVPALYAVAAALIFSRAGFSLPLPLDRTVNLLGAAAIPVLMVLMGIQLQQANWNGEIKALTIASAMKLVAAPLVGMLIAVLFGLQGAARQAGILESATPTAVVITVLAVEYDVEPAFVTSAVVVSTLLSPLTITPILAYLGA